MPSVAGPLRKQPLPNKERDHSFNSLEEEQPLFTKTKTQRYANLKPIQALNATLSLSPTLPSKDPSNPSGLLVLHPTHRPIFTMDETSQAWIEGFSYNSISY